MTGMQFFITYSVCWWLVLFMVLPFGAEPAKHVEKGHVPSAPARPNIRKKLKITTWLAFIPALLLYGVMNMARAEEDSIYHARSGCKPLEAYHAPEGVHAVDGVGASGAAVAPASMGSSTVLGDMKHVDIPLEIPASGYIDPSQHNVNLSQSNAAMGTLRVGMDGSTELNGQPIAAQPSYPAGCGDAPASTEK